MCSTNTRNLFSKQFVCAHDIRTTSNTLLMTSEDEFEKLDNADRQGVIESETCLVLEARWLWSQCVPYIFVHVNISGWCSTAHTELMSIMNNWIKSNFPHHFRWAEGHFLFQLARNPFRTENSQVSFLHSILSAAAFSTFSVT